MTSLVSAALLVAVLVAELTGSLLAWAASVASGAWLVWMGADQVMRQIVRRSVDGDTRARARRTLVTGRGRRRDYVLTGEALL